MEGRWSGGPIGVRSSLQHLSKGWCVVVFLEILLREKKKTTIKRKLKIFQCAPWVGSAKKPQSRAELLPCAKGKVLAKGLALYRQPHCLGTALLWVFYHFLTQYFFHFPVWREEGSQV